MKTAANVYNQIFWECGPTVKPQVMAKAHKPFVKWKIANNTPRA
jgi:hypothetical protein